MKRILLTILAVLAFASMSMAQDVYYSGYYTSPTTGLKRAAVYKNNTKLYETYSSGNNCESTSVVYADNHVFWSNNATAPNGYYVFADIYKDGDPWMEGSTNQYRHINDMYFGGAYSNIYAVGSMVINGVQRAVVWSGLASQSSCSTSPYYTMGNTNYDSEALAVTEYDGHIFVVGIQYLSEGNDSYRGVLWKDGVEFVNFGQNYKPYGISNYDGNIRVIGDYYESSNYYLRGFSGTPDTPSEHWAAWQLTSPSHGYDIDWDPLMFYFVGNQGNQLKVWYSMVSEEVFSHTTSGSNNALRAVVANPKGIYYAGQLNNQGKVWKDGSVLYSPSDCNYIYDMSIQNPTCTQTTYNLPFTEDFEYGSTHWPCWTNDGSSNSWNRSRSNGELNRVIARGYGWSDGDSWLKSPKLNIPSGSGTTTLTFESKMIMNSGSYPSGGCKVMVSTSSIPTLPSFTEVLSINASNTSWQTVTVDLSAYNGQSIYIAFKIGNSSNRYDWLIDDISVTQSAPTQYTITANANPTSGGTVSGGGTYNQGATCTLTATPASGYEFLYWKKGNTQVSTNATYSFTVTESATYTAYFQQAAPTQYTITVNANNNAWGTVSGGGQYNAGATCTLHATPASGYQFDSWKKNGSVVSTNPNYSFTVTENATYTAYFSAEPVTYYTITVNASPSNGGTVTGGGTYPAGSSVTLTATPNNGYAFSQWQDGSTANPRTITVNGDATYTASFTQLQYTINVYANPTNGGTVYGGGTYQYGQTVTIGATANSGYEFAGWNDGSTSNPRTITVTGNANYTAIFSAIGTTYYTVTTHVSPANAGTVTGGGTYEAGTSIVLQATANSGYSFNRWNDGSTQNPRSITVNSNLDFTAIFTQNQYTITVVANPTTAGSVSGGGAYYYGDNATLYATAFSGYEFVGWNDGSTENPHTVTVTGSATYTATFSEIGTTYYTVSTHVSPPNAGTVTGSGTYPAGSTVTVQAEPNDGYVFLRWNDGLTTNPRTVTVNNNMSFTAYFRSNNYTITANASPTEGGSVTGGGVYAYGQTATLQAVANSGYTFLQWSDGNSNNPRTVTVTGNATYTALFKSISGTTYTVTVTSAQPELGSVFGGGTYAAGMSIQIAAYPNENAHFVRWDDGNTDNPRTVTVNGNLSFEAHFAADQTYTIEVLSNNPEMGNAFGSGTFVEGSQIQISAVPFQGYIFTGWDDGNTDNPRTITVTGNATYKAMFSENSVITHTVTLICNTAEGSVTGGGVYVHGTQAYIQAIPNQGYQFTKWSDENTDNPRVIEVTSDITLAAFFGVGVDENEHANILVYPNPAKESIRIMGIEANSEIAIYNVLGELVKMTNASADEEIGIRDLAPGLYLVRCGNVTLRFVKN